MSFCPSVLTAENEDLLTPDNSDIKTGFWVMMLADFKPRQAYSVIYIFTFLYIYIYIYIYICFLGFDFFYRPNVL
jgi:hypothetical protein